MAVLALCFVPQGAWAQDDASGADAVQQNGQIPPYIPTSAFASQSALSGAELSPDGSRFVFSTKQGKDTYLVVHDADTREMLNGIGLGEIIINWFRWVGNSKVLFSLRTGEYWHMRRLYYLDLDTGVVVPIEKRGMGWDADNVVFVDPDGRYVLVTMDGSVWRFSLTGDGPSEPVMVQAKHRDVGSWLADETGTVRIGIGVGRTGSAKLRYRSSARDEWEQVARMRLDREDLQFWDFMGLRSGSDVGFSLGVPEGGQRRSLMEFDFSTGQLGRIVHQSDSADISSVTFDDANNPVALGYAGEGFRREWLDPEIASQRRALANALPGSWVTIQDVSANGERMLVRQSGSNDPGTLYVFTPGEGRLDLVSELRPQLVSGYLAEPQDLRYTARDGTAIHGFLTLPRGRAPENLPLIVYPHGGPFGIRSTDSYDDWLQLLANRGYAVVQPNFRGSGGYGVAFEELGEGQIGRAMQDDLDDAVAHLVSERIVDPQRVCIVGASYGGFAAIWGAIRNPEIYRCAASWAGVTHFERQLSHDRDYLFGRNRGRHTNRVDGDQTNFDLDDVSVAVQVSRLTRPVLLAHGERDNRVPFTQYELMMDRAEDAGVALESLVLEESGHGFSSAEDEQAWFDALVDFLARHNPPDAR